MDWGSGERYEFSFSFLVFQHACSIVVCGRILSARKFWTRHLGFGNCGRMGWGKICRESRRAPFLYRLSIQSKMAASKTACTASYPSHQRPNFLSHLNFPFWLTCLFFFSLTDLLRWNENNAHGFNSFVCFSFLLMHHKQRWKSLNEMRISWSWCSFGGGDNFFVNASHCWNFVRDNQ